MRFGIPIQVTAAFVRGSTSSTSTRDSGTHPGPIIVRRTIVTNAASIARYALEEVPNHAFSDVGAAGTVVAAIHRRLSGWWPELTSEAP